MKNFLNSWFANEQKSFFTAIVLFIILLFMGCMSKVAAQVTLDNITATEGKGAMTSGLDFVISLSTPNGVIFGAQANNERSNLRFGKKWGNFSALFTAGAFKNVPWVGPMFIYKYKCIDLFSWSGIGMATNKHFTDPGWKPAFFFDYQEAGLTLGKNRLAYSILFFATEKINQFAIYRRTFPLGEKNKFFVETTYDFTKDIPMFVLGYSHSFAKK
jgi:hypothetical protein